MGPEDYDSYEEYLDAPLTEERKQQLKGSFFENRCKTEREVIALHFELMA